ncbi:hypothetical protein [Stenotrophomonas sp.]|uniref:hypothetical protein n=1 Tax=Stenotrophomonas sp. TaxID=69392 RepID=UPI0028ACD6E2|nr:hypothetical protein [Stenotrophomonas sp.]
MDRATYRTAGMLAKLRRPQPARITARDMLRRHLHDAGRNLDSLATAWNCRRFSVWRIFQRTDRPLQPHHVEGAIAALSLDEFDANELRLRAAREAGWAIDTQFLMEQSNG